MNAMRKILVVDDGRRDEFDPLSQELAELGVSSVTASFEAADDVLSIIERPSAILLKMPAARCTVAYESFMTLAADLKRRDDVVGVPVILWDGLGAAAGSISAVLTTHVGSYSMSGHDN